MNLNETNIEESINKYLNLVNSINFPIHQTNILKLMETLKRENIGSGPYPNVSLFEASNRIFSDMVILFGIKRLLIEPKIGNIPLPFAEYEVALGVESGNDIKASSNNQLLIGEAFNVASSFFQAKKGSMIKKLNSHELANYRLIIFNSDAVRKPEEYIKMSKTSMLYLPIDIWAEMKSFQNI